MWTTLRVMTARVRDHWRRDKLDRELDQELAAHLAMAEDDKVRQGMSREEARRTARVELGGLTQLREASREVRGLPWLDTLGIDFKLGLRMLRKHPLLTVVAGLTLALGIPAALTPTHLIGAFEAPLPVEDGHRIVGLRYWNLIEGEPAQRLVHDYAVWREELRSFETIGAVRRRAWNVHSEDGRAAEVFGSEMTASTFDLLRVPPLMGRTIVESDEIEGASDIVVISADLWSSRFARDPEIVGKVIGIGRRPHTVVGVMPEGFLFPIMGHLWLPLRVDPNDYAVGDGPVLFVLGRLADGASPERASLELQTIGERLSYEWPATHGSLRAEAVKVSTLVFGDRGAGFGGDALAAFFVQLLAYSLLAVACGNVGVLILARTATRVGEISVRTALGASRARILSQLFVEALVLSVGATAVGLVVVQELMVRFGSIVVDGGVPYWVDLGFGAPSILLALGLAAGSAVLAGVLPAIRATNPDVQRGLQRKATGTTLGFGPFTTALVVAEVALSVGFLCLGAAALQSFVPDHTDRADIDVDRYLVAGLRTPWVEPTEVEADGYQDQYRTRVAANVEGLRNRLRAEASVGRVGMGVDLAGMDHQDRTLVIGGEPGGDGSRATRALTATVHVEYFQDMGLDVLSGRGFATADVEGDPEVRQEAIVVNDQFVDQVFRGAEAIGRRIRYGVGEGYGPWLEIVGVVESFGTNVQNPERAAALYRPVASSDVTTMRYIIEVPGDPADFVPRLRQLAAEVDPDVIVQEPRALSEIVARTRLEDLIITWAVFILSAMGMILAATGLYALLSFTVSQRTREIGIRTALGAGASNVIGVIVRRALLQLLAGVALGSWMGTWIVGMVAGQSEFTVDNVPALVAGVAVGVMVFSALACLAPTLRGLRIEPMEALREA